MSRQLKTDSKFLLACKAGSLRKVKSALEANPQSLHDSINYAIPVAVGEAEQKRFSHNGLHLAIINCHPEIVEYLLTTLISNAPDMLGNTLYHYAAKCYSPNPRDNKKNAAIAKIVNMLFVAKVPGINQLNNGHRHVLNYIDAQDQLWQPYCQMFLAAGANFQSVATNTTLHPLFTALTAGDLRKITFYKQCETMFWLQNKGFYESLIKHLVNLKKLQLLAEFCLDKLIDLDFQKGAIVCLIEQLVSEHEIPLLSSILNGAEVSLVPVDAKILCQHLLGTEFHAVLTNLMSKNRIVLSHTLNDYLDLFNQHDALDILIEISTEVESFLPPGESRVAYAKYLLKVRLDDILSILMEKEKNSLLFCQQLLPSLLQKRSRPQCVNIIALCVAQHQQSLDTLLKLVVDVVHIDYLLKTFPTIGTQDINISNLDKITTEKALWRTPWRAILNRMFSTGEKPAVLPKDLSNNLFSDMMGKRLLDFKLLIFLNSAIMASETQKNKNPLACEETLKLVTCLSMLPIELQCMVVARAVISPDKDPLTPALTWRKLRNENTRPPMLLPLWQGKATQRIRFRQAHPEQANQEQAARQQPEIVQEAKCVIA